MDKFKKSPLIASLIIVLVIILGVFGVLSFAGDNQRDEVLNSSAEDPGPTGVLIESEDGKQFNYVGVAGESLLDSLKALAEVETESFSFGEFVLSINDNAAVSGESFWALYINGEAATVGADNYIAEPGDRVEWRLEAIEL